MVKRCAFVTVCLDVAVCAWLSLHTFCLRTRGSVSAVSLCILNHVLWLGVVWQIVGLSRRECESGCGCVSGTVADFGRDRFSNCCYTRGRRSLPVTCFVSTLTFRVETVGEVIVCLCVCDRLQTKCSLSPTSSSLPIPNSSHRPGHRYLFLYIPSVLAPCDVSTEGHLDSICSKMCICTKTIYNVADSSGFSLAAPYTFLFYNFS